MAISDEWNTLERWDGAVAVLEIDEHLIFIKRSISMPTHPGQIAFIGGLRQQPEDVPLNTARREFEEELGIDSNGFVFQGYSQPVITAKGKRIIPCKFISKMGLQQFFQSVKSNGEWTRIFAIPKNFLINESHWVYSSGLWNDEIHKIYFIPLLAVIQIANGEKSDELLWGATAQMVQNLLTDLK